MKHTIIIAAIVATLSFFSANANAFEKENFYNEKYCDFLGGKSNSYYTKEETGATGAYIDCDTVTIAWEGEWAYKSYEAVGQALWYASFTNKIPGIIFYITKPNQEKYIKRAVLTLDSFGIYYQIKIVNLYIPEIMDLNIGETL